MWIRHNHEAAFCEWRQHSDKQCITYSSFAFVVDENALHPRVRVGVEHREIFNVNLGRRTLFRVANGNSIQDSSRLAVKCVRSDYFCHVMFCYLFTLYHGGVLNTLTAISYEESTRFHSPETGYVHQARDTYGHAYEESNRSPLQSAARRWGYGI